VVTASHVTIAGPNGVSGSFPRPPELGAAELPDRELPEEFPMHLSLRDLPRPLRKAPPVPSDGKANMLTSFEAYRDLRRIGTDDYTTPIGESPHVMVSEAWRKLREHYMGHMVAHDPRSSRFGRTYRVQGAYDLPHVWELQAEEGMSGVAAQRCRRNRKFKEAEELDALDAFCSYQEDILPALRNTIADMVESVLIDVGGDNIPKTSSLLDVPEVCDMLDMFMPLYNMLAEQHALMVRRLEMLSLSEGDSEMALFGSIMREATKAGTQVYSANTRRSLDAFKYEQARQFGKQSAAKSVGGLLATTSTHEIGTSRKEKEMQKQINGLQKEIRRLTKDSNPPGKPQSQEKGKGTGVAA